MFDHPTRCFALALCALIALPLAVFAANPLAPDGATLTWSTPPGATGPTIAFVAWPGPGVPAEELSRIGREGLARWQAATGDAFAVQWWTGGGKPPPPADDGVSTIVFGSMVGAVDDSRPATALVRSRGGVITEVDIVINDGAFPVTVDPIAANPIFGPLDLDIVLTHELGHALGLDHSGVLEATMSPWPWAGQATLACDDVAGVRRALGLPGEAISGRAVMADGGPAGGLMAMAVEPATGRIVAGTTDADGRFDVGLPHPGAWIVGVGPYPAGSDTLAGGLPTAPCDGETPRQWLMDPDRPGAMVIQVDPGANARVGSVPVRCDVTPDDGAPRLADATDLRTGDPVFEPTPDPEPDAGPGRDPSPPAEIGEACDPLAPRPCAADAWCDDHDLDDAVCRDNICGDGHRGRHEECDDGNDRRDDGCWGCRIRPVPLGGPCAADGPPCSAAGRCDVAEGRCVAHVCGDGVMSGDEVCDAGWEGGPSCSADCRLVPLYDDSAAPDSAERPGRLPFDDRGDARLGFTLDVGESDWFALDLPYAARVSARIEDPRDDRCVTSALRIVPAGRPEGEPIAVAERGVDVCVSLRVDLPPGRYLMRASTRGNRNHEDRWLEVRRRALPAIGERCADVLAPCPDDAYCDVEGICQRHTCGDGRLGPGEACDDGNFTEGDGCTAGCDVAPVPVGGPCHDDVVCVEGAFCDGRCRLHRCGDGVVGPGEACDDGDPDDADGCDAACRFSMRDVFARPIGLDVAAGARYVALTAVAGTLTVHALDWGLHGDRSVRLELLDVRGVSVPGARGETPRRRLDDGFVDQDATLIAEGLPFGDYVLKMTANALPGRTSPRGGRLRTEGSPVLLVGAITPEPLALGVDCAPSPTAIPPETPGPAPTARRSTSDDCAVMPGRGGPVWPVAMLLLGGLMLRIRFAD